MLFAVCNQVQGNLRPRFDLVLYQKKVIEHPQIMNEIQFRSLSQAIRKLTEERSLSWCPVNSFFLRLPLPIFSSYPEQGPKSPLLSTASVPSQGTPGEWGDGTAALPQLPAIVFLVLPPHQLSCLPSSCSLCSHSFSCPGRYQQPLRALSRLHFSQHAQLRPKADRKPHVGTSWGAAQMEKTRQVWTPQCLCGSCCSTEAPFTLPSSSTGFQHQGSPLSRAERIPSFLLAEQTGRPLLFPLSASGSWNHLTLSGEFHLSSRFVLHLLLNWTLVGLPSTQQSESTYTRVWWRKVSADRRAEQGEWSPYSQDPNFLMAFREGFLKMVFVLRTAEVMAFFGWLVVRQ